MNEPIFSDAAIDEHAARVAEAVRAINHLSIGGVADSALPYPSDVAAVVADLTRAAHALPQALGQLAARVDRFNATGLLREDVPDPAGVDRAVRASVLLAGEAAQRARGLASVLDAAVADLSHLAYADPPRRRRAAAPVPEPPVPPESGSSYGIGL